MKRALVYLADGFEECEALLVVDILRRAGIDTVTVSITNNLVVIRSGSMPTRCWRRRILPPLTPLSCRAVFPVRRIWRPARL